MTVIAIAALAITVLFRLSSDSRMAVCILVSVATITLALRSLLTGKIVWALLFLSVLGVFTPFQRPQFSNLLISVLDMATLALFAASPMILRKPIRPVVVNVPLEKL
jgi:type IV secretory pathway VirB2 component (pilin)